MTYENYNKNSNMLENNIQSGGNDTRTWTGFWQDDNERTTCNYCDKAINKGSRHHCRFGGELICDECSRLEDNNLLQINIPFHLKNNKKPEKKLFRICKFHYNKFFRKCISCNQPINITEIQSFINKPCNNSIIWPIHSKCISIEEQKYTDCKNKIDNILTTIMPLILPGFDTDITNYHNPLIHPNIKSHTFTGAMYDHQSISRHPFLSIVNTNQKSKIENIEKRLTKVAEHTLTWINMGYQLTTDEFESINLRGGNFTKIDVDIEKDLKTNFLKEDDITEYTSYLFQTRFLAIEHYKNIASTLDDNEDIHNKLLEFILEHEGLDIFIENLIKAPLKKDIWDLASSQSKLKYDREEYYLDDPALIQDIDEFKLLFPWFNKDKEDADVTKRKRVTDITTQIQTIENMISHIRSNILESTFTSYLQIEQDGIDVINGIINDARVNKYTSTTHCWIIAAKCFQKENIFTKKEIESLRMSGTEKQGKEAIFLTEKIIKNICNKNNNTLKFLNENYDNKSYEELNEYMFNFIPYDKHKFSTIWSQFDNTITPRPKLKFRKPTTPIKDRNVRVIQQEIPGMNWIPRTEEEAERDAALLKKKESDNEREEANTN